MAHKRKNHPMPGPDCNTLVLYFLFYSEALIPGQGFVLISVWIEMFAAFIVFTFIKHKHLT